MGKLKAKEVVDPMRGFDILQCNVACRLLYIYMRASMA